MVTMGPPVLGFTGAGQGTDTCFGVDICGVNISGADVSRR